MKKEVLTEKIIKKYQTAFQSDPQNRVLKNAIIKNGIHSVSMNHDSIINMQYTFSNEIKTGKVTSQKRTGRCWLFAGLNTLRHKVADDFDIKNFELSQNFPMFWDKLEKANYFLECILDTVEEDIYSRIVMWLLRNIVQDGGQWDMFYNLITKYGIVPKYVMPETYHSSNSYKMNHLLKLKLREYAYKLRDGHSQKASMKELKQQKSEMMTEIYKMLVFFLGEPPERFDFEYRSKKNDKDNENNEDNKNSDLGEFHQDRNLTPKSFLEKYVDLDMDAYVSLINAPTTDKPFNQTYTVKYLNNVVDGRDILYLNIDRQSLKDATLAQLKDEETVWFGCDVGKMMDSKTGIMDTELFLFDGALGIDFGLSKAQRLDYGESKLTHAMVFTGVNLVDGNPNRWKVENSWGKKPGEKGYFVMGDDWFDEFNYQVVVNKKYLPDKLLEALKEKPIELPPWDPMGSLAMMR